jgi:hypothetical protein
MLTSARYTSIARVAPTLFLLCGCGANTPSVPTTPTPTPSTNQAPQISSVTVSPALAVIGLATFTAHVDARDPDGDPLTYAWVAPGPKPVGANSADLSFTAGEAGAPLRITVTDNKGAAASGQVEFVAADLDGLYDGYFGSNQGLQFSMVLRRTGTTVTGTFHEARGDHNGVIDPAEPGTIDGAGNFRIRVKLGSLDDMIFIGRLISRRDPRFLSNFVGTGHVQGGGFDGQSFTFGFHDPY